LVASADFAQALQLYNVIQTQGKYQTKRTSRYTSVNRFRTFSDVIP